ncbi:hypothetical protein MMC18_000904 [Xylographa bjoerkii]|nr:hypothetical protein [Xylographa bjoerkii]
MEVIAVAQHEIMRQYTPTQITAILPSEPQMWVLINNFFTQERNSDLHFWWRATGFPFAVLLHQAGYAINHQCQNLLFYYCCVAPELGPGPNAQGAPRHWRSFMTDHFCPVELSWEWGYPGDSPTIRFSFEPIGPEAGTGADPFNQYSVSRLAHQYKRILPKCDLRSFDHFSKKLLSYSDNKDEMDRSRKRFGHESRAFVAFDFGNAGVTLKAYFIPGFKALEMGKSSLDLISEAIQSLPDYAPSRYKGLSALLNFSMTYSEGAGLEAEIFAIDCVAPNASRLKIYMRGRSTCFKSVQEIMTLGGAVVEPDLAHGLKELHRLWNLVLGKEPDVPSAQDLYQNGHRTAGILYYFDIRPGQTLPGVKVYIPIRHYSQNDLVVAEGLKTYLESRGQGLLARKYIEALRRMS